jgi:hypothetical protein
MAGYASQTSVSIDRTKAEIETTLRRYGAGKFSSGWDEAEGIAFVNFHCHERYVRFTVPVPKPTERRFTHGGRNGYTKRTDAQAAEAYEQEMRAVWRRLLLVIKAKLESVDSKIETFEESFLAQIVIPNGETMGQWAKQNLQSVLDLGAMPLALPPHQPGA